MPDYGLDSRERIITALEAGRLVADVAERCAISGRTVRRYRQQ
jgi:DNA-binding NarL/FixJ family response regulator